MDLPIDSFLKTTLNIPHFQQYQVNLEDESYQQQRDSNKGGGRAHRTLLIGVQTGQPPVYPLDPVSYQMVFSILYIFLLPILRDILHFVLYCSYFYTWQLSG